MLRKLNERGLRLPEGSENQVLLATRLIRDHYFPNRNKNFPEWILIFAILKILNDRPDATLEQIVEIVTTPALAESCELRREIHSVIAACRHHTAKHGWNQPNVFNGSKQFEYEKLGAMTAYFATRGPRLCRETLSTLLFYADFGHYYLHQASISGSKYVRLRHGPMQENYERMIDSMVANGIVKLNQTANNEQVTKLSDSILEKLTINELTTLHWAISAFGSMPVSALYEQNKNEGSHRFTRRGDYIAYEYAPLLKNLPQPSLT